MDTQYCVANSTDAADGIFIILSFALLAQINLQMGFIVIFPYNLA
jgi:hypothetical protein